MISDVDVVIDVTGHCESDWCIIGVLILQLVLIEHTGTELFLDFVYILNYSSITDYIRVLIVRLLWFTLASTYHSTVGL